MSKYKHSRIMNKHRLKKIQENGRVRSTETEVCTDEILRIDGKDGMFDKDIPANAKLYQFSHTRFHGTNYAICAFKKTYGPQFAVPVSKLS